MQQLNWDVCDFWFVNLECDGGYCCCCTATNLGGKEFACRGTCFALNGFSFMQNAFSKTCLQFENIFDVI